jgi:hypothetical protein
MRLNFIKNCDVKPFFPQNSPESFRKDIFPTRLFGSVEKIDDFFTVDPDGVEKDDGVENNVEKVGRRSRYDDIGITKKYVRL